MSEKIPTKRTPITRSKEARKDSDTPKIRPGKEPDARVNHGVNSLDALLKQNLDGRLAIVRKRDQLESQLINHAGGLQAVTPSMLLLIRRIVHKTLVCDQAERMSLLGRYDFSGKQYICLSNSLRLDITAFENMIKNRPTKRVPSLDEWIEQQKQAKKNEND